ncbi:Uncharacterised protein [Bordetella pertussis]|nr:Uncharacterised protein [Bordetella pertussis]
MAGDGLPWSMQARPGSTQRPTMRWNRSGATLA